MTIEVHEIDERGLRLLIAAMIMTMKDATAAWLIPESAKVFADLYDEIIQGLLRKDGTVVGAVMADMLTEETSRNLLKLTGHTTDSAGDA